MTNPYMTLAEAQTASANENPLEKAGKGLLAFTGNYLNRTPIFGGVMDAARAADTPGGFATAGDAFLSRPRVLPGQSGGGGGEAQSQLFPQQQQQGQPPPMLMETSALPSATGVQGGTSAPNPFPRGSSQGTTTPPLTSSLDSSAALRAKARLGSAGSIRTSGPAQRSRAPGLDPNAFEQSRAMAEDLYDVNKQLQAVGQVAGALDPGDPGRLIESITPYLMAQPEGESEIERMALLEQFQKGNQASPALMQELGRIRERKHARVGMRAGMMADMVKQRFQADLMRRNSVTDNVMTHRRTATQAMYQIDLAQANLFQKERLARMENAIAWKDLRLREDAQRMTGGFKMKDLLALQKQHGDPLRDASMKKSTLASLQASLLDGVKVGPVSGRTSSLLSAVFGGEDRAFDTWRRQAIKDIIASMPSSRLGDTEKEAARLEKTMPSKTANLQTWKDWFEKERRETESKMGYHEAAANDIIGDWGGSGRGYGSHLRSNFQSLEELELEANILLENQTVQRKQAMEAELQQELYEERESPRDLFGMGPKL